MDNDAGMVIFLEQDRFLRRLLLSEENILSWRIHIFVARSVYWKICSMTQAIPVQST